MDRLDRAARRDKRDKKKARAAKIKLQKRLDLGIGPGGTNAVQDNGENLFTLAGSKKTRKIRDRIRAGVDAGIESSLVPEEELKYLMGKGGSESDESDYRKEGEDDEEEDDYMDRIEAQIDSHHQRMKDIKARRPSVAPLSKGQHMIKRKMAARIEQAEKDRLAEEYRTGEEAHQDYLKMLARGGEDSDDDGDDSSDADGRYNDSDDAEDERNAAAVAAARRASDAAATTSSRRGSRKRNEGGADGGPAEGARASASRWFSNPAFAEQDDEDDMMGHDSGNDRGTSDDSDDDDSDDNSGSANTNSGGRGKDLSHLKLDLGEMPKSDKEIRKERRRKVRERAARKEARREAKRPVDELQMQTVAGEASDDDSDADGRGTTASAAHMQLIRAGMGDALAADDGSTGRNGMKFETVGAADSDDSDSDDSESDDDGSGRASRKRKRRAGDGGPEGFDEENDGVRGDAGAESSDDEQRAHTLAMGTLMAFSHAREKELIDASYNRYSWNDAADLPDWFVEDEKEHNRPQLPVTREMVQASRRRFLELSKAPIKKVAEARARKKMRMVKAMEKAKRLANKIAEDTDLSTRSKMRAIEKAMNRSHVKKTGSVTVRVTKGNKARRGGGKKGAGGMRVKFADKRMRSDERGMKRAAQGGKRKKRKGGGKGKKRTRHFN